MLKNKLKIQFGKLHAYLLLFMAVLIAADLLTKHFEEAYSWNFVVIPNWIVVKSGIRNSGCAFSFLGDAEWGQAFLIALTIVMLVGLVAVFVFMPQKHVLLNVSLSMVMAGAVANLVDRIMFVSLPIQGGRGVRDFVELNMIFSRAVCNFADFWIVIGAVLMMLDILFFAEFAVIPLTQKGKQYQAEQERLEKEKQQSHGEH